MNFFEKNIKDRFKNASSLNGIDADDLWKNIESSIETESPERKFIFLRNRYWLLLLSLFLIGGAVVWYQSSDEYLSNSEINNSDANIVFQNIEGRDAESKNLSQTENNNTITDKENENLTIIQNEMIENTPAIILSKSENKNQNFNQTVHQESLTVFEKNNTLLHNDNPKNNSYKNELIKNNLQKEPTPTQNNEQQTEQLFNGQKIDFTKEIESIDLLLPNEKEDQISLNDLIVLPKFKDKNSKFSLGVFTGIHIMKNNFSSTLASDNDRKNLLNQGLQLEPGYSIAIEANYHFNENISITSGLEYVKSKSEFNFNQTWDTIIVNPNSPVGSLTDAVADRTVRHHNKMDYFSVPILLNFQKSIGKIELGMGTGVGLNFIKTQTGKSLDASNQVAIYPTTENDLLPISKFFLSYHLRPYVNYALDEKISFQLRTDFRFQDFGESDFYQLKYSSTFWGLSGGIQYNF